MKTILVSLISEQTIPNLQFIKEKKVDSHLFVSTHKMEKKGSGKSLIEVSGLDENLVQIIVVDAFSYEEIYNALEEVVDDENHYIINLTGGTKIMTLAVHDFFKDLSSEIYYLTGKNEYIKIFPGRKKTKFKLEHQVNLEDYLKAYGFKVRSKGDHFWSFKEATNVLQYFLHEITEKDLNVLLALRPFRDKNKKLEDLKTIDGFEALLKKLDFKAKDPEKLTKYEIRYLTGEWLEQYVYYSIKENLKISEDFIGMGWKLEKQGQSNEFDVLYVNDNKLYIIECKTSVYKEANKKSTIIPETIYKSDSLRNQLGLFANTSIFTLDDINAKNFETHLKRAEASKVTVKGKNSFINNELI